MTGFAGGVHQVTSAASTQPAALRTAHDWSAQASQALPLAALPHTLARVVAQLALGLVPLVLLCGVTVRVQRCAVARQSSLSSQYGSKLGPSRLQSIGGPGSGFFVHCEPAGNVPSTIRVALNSFCVALSPSHRRMEGPSACNGSLLKAASFSGASAGASR